MQDSLFFERRVAYEVHRPPAGCSKMFFQELKVTHWLKSLILDSIKTTIEASEDRNEKPSGRPQSQ